MSEVGYEWRTVWLVGGGVFFLACWLFYGGAEEKDDPDSSKVRGRNLTGICDSDEGLRWEDETKEHLDLATQNWGVIPMRTLFFFFSVSIIWVVLGLRCGYKILPPRNCTPLAKAALMQNVIFAWYWRFLHKIGNSGPNRNMIGPLRAILCQRCQRCFIAWREERGRVAGTWSTRRQVKEDKIRWSGVSD